MAQNRIGKRRKKVSRRRRYAPRPLDAPTLARIERVFSRPGSAPPWLRRLYLLLRDTGMRVGEALALRGEHLSLQPGTESIRIDVAKGGQGRTVPILSRRLALALRRVRVRTRDLLFPGRGLTRQITPRPITYVGARLAWLRTLRQHGIEHPPNLHRLRHTFATELAHRGLSAWDLQRAVGWRTLEMASHYVQARDARDSIGTLGR